VFKYATQGRVPLGLGGGIAKDIHEGGASESKPQFDAAIFLSDLKIHMPEQAAVIARVASIPSTLPSVMPWTSNH